MFTVAAYWWLYLYLWLNIFIVHRNMISVVHLFGITSWSPAQDFLSNGWCYIVHIWHKMIVCPFSHTHDHTHSFSNVFWHFRGCLFFDQSTDIYFNLLRLCMIVGHSVSDTNAAFVASSVLHVALESGWCRLLKAAMTIWQTQFDKTALLSEEVYWEMNFQDYLLCKVWFLLRTSDFFYF